MTGDEKYIAQMTRDDLKKIAALTNITVEPGVKITPTSNGLKIGIDKQQLKLWLWTFNRNGGFSASQENVTSVEIDDTLT